VSEDTHEVAAKSFLQIILAHNWPGAQLIKPLEGYCLKHHRKEQGLDVVVASG
jgi:hypothetical protein